MFCDVHGQYMGNFGEKCQVNLFENIGIGMILRLGIGMDLGYQYRYKFSSGYLYRYRYQGIGGMLVFCAYVWICIIMYGHIWS